MAIRRFFFLAAAAILTAALSCKDGRNAPAEKPPPPEELSSPSPKGTSPQAASPLDPDATRTWVRAAMERLIATLKDTPSSSPHPRLLAPLQGELHRAAWASPDALLEVLRLASRHKDVPGLLTSLEAALRSSSSAADLSLFDRDLTQSIAKFALTEKDPALRRLHLSLLLRHNATVYDGKPRLLLDPRTIEAVLNLEVGPKDPFAEGHLTALAGMYCDATPAAREFLERMILDRELPFEKRREALWRYSRGPPLTPDRADLARRLLEKEPNRKVRLSALGLVASFSAGPLPERLESRVYEMLKSTASRDSDPEVREKAAWEIIQRSDARAISFAEAILSAERDPDARSGMVEAFRWYRAEKPGLMYQAQDLTLRVYERDKDEGVRGSAMDAFLSLVDKTLLVPDESGNFSVDPETVERILKAAQLLPKRTLKRTDKLKLKDRLENNFERMFPDLPGFEPYQKLKRYLEEE